MIRPMMRRWMLAIVVGAAVTLVSAPPVLAHVLKVFAEVTGDMIVGQGYFSGDSFPANTTVEIFGPGHQKIGQVTTDAQGKFSFKPAKRQNHTFVIEGGEGHRAEWTVESDELPTSLPAR
jgi:nickel transport protein